MQSRERPCSRSPGPCSVPRRSGSRCPRRAGPADSWRSRHPASICSTRHTSAGPSAKCRCLPREDPGWGRARQGARLGNTQRHSRSARGGGALRRGSAESHTPTPRDTRGGRPRSIRIWPRRRQSGPRAPRTSLLRLTLLCWHQRPRGRGAGLGSTGTSSGSPSPSPGQPAIAATLPRVPAPWAAQRVGTDSSASERTEGGAAAGRNQLSFRRVSAEPGRFRGGTHEMRPREGRAVLGVGVLSRPPALVSTLLLLLTPSTCSPSLIVPFARARNQPWRLRHASSTREP